jgi:lipopolysaccharide heptosyltransferase II
MTSEPWSHINRILCVRLDFLGDVLMSTPAIRALKRSFAGCKVSLLSSASGAAVAHYVPEIDEIIEYAAPWVKLGEEHATQVDLDMIDRLSSCQFDAAVIFTVYSQNPLPAAMLCYLAGIPLRLAHCRENPYRLLTHWVQEKEPQEFVRHEVKRQLDLVASIGACTADERLSFAPLSSDLAWACDCLQAMGVDRRGTWIILHPGASAASRRYPLQHWTRVAQDLAKRLKCPLLFTGTEDEVPLIEEIRREVPDTHSLAGRLDLGKLAAIISLAPLMIVNNTGPVHIAAAVGTPVVDLYALTNPQHTPWQVPSRVLFHDVPCRYCYKSVCPQGHHHCLSLVEPERVVEAALELLESAPALAQLTNTPQCRPISTAETAAAYLPHALRR